MSEITRVAGRPRRSQEERSAATTAKLLDATIESLIEVGYEQTTSRAVADRAGVSRGAESHHFPRRLDLIVGAVERIGQLRRDAVLVELKEVPRDAGRLRALLDALWKYFSSPLFIATLKLWVAAQEDRELYERLIPVERETSRAIMIGFEELMGDHPDFPDLVSRYTIALSTLRGLAVTNAFAPRTDSGGDRSWPYFRDLLEQLLDD